MMTGEKRVVPSWIVDLFPDSKSFTQEPGDAGLDRPVIAGHGMCETLQSLEVLCFTQP
jgi:hypothetical protein